MKSRVEVNELGEFVIVIPNDVIDDYDLDEGDLLEWDTEDSELIILSVA